jgi:flagellar hook-basal body complex protein FliE
MIAPIGGIGGSLSLGQLGSAGSEPAAGLGLGEASGTSGSALGSSKAAAGGVTGAGGLEGIGSVEGSTGIEGAGAAESTGAGSGSGGLGEALTNAISSLDQTQQSASSAAQGLATGTISDPEAAVVTVEEAQLAMQLASQIRTKATEAAQQLFQTQV